MEEAAAENGDAVDAEVVGQPQSDQQQSEKQNDATRRTMALALNERGTLILTRFQDQWDAASAAYKSGTLGPGIKTTAQAWAIMQRGSELGFPLLTAVEYLYIVKGRIRMTPDGAKAKALASGLLQDFREYLRGDPGSDDFAAVCEVKRAGIATPIVRDFSIADAKTARLWSKADSAWQTYPKRMLAARARGFAFGDAFRDVCGGLQIRERFDLDPGERLGGELLEGPKPPALPQITERSAPTERHPVIAQLVGQKAPEPAAYDPAEGVKRLEAACLERVSGDTEAAGKLRYEVARGGVATQEDFDAAMAALRAHPHFGDEPPVLTSPEAKERKR